MKTKTKKDNKVAKSAPAKVGRKAFAINLVSKKPFTIMSVVNKYKGKFSYTVVRNHIARAIADGSLKVVGRKPIPRGQPALILEAAYLEAA